MNILKGWEECLNNPSPRAGPALTIPPLRRSPEYYAGQTTLVRTAEDAASMLELARQRPLGWIGLALRTEDPGHEPHSGRPHPTVLALATVEPGGGGDTIYSFVIDLGSPEVFGAIRGVFGLSTTFLIHDAGKVLLQLMELGLPIPNTLWDTRICERALHLGRDHPRYRGGESDDVGIRARAYEETERGRDQTLSLGAILLRYDIDATLPASHRPRIEGSQDVAGLQLPSITLLREAVEDAVSVVRLYRPQVDASVSAGILHHLITVEMPFAATLAGIARRGVRVDPEKRRAVTDACKAHAKELTVRLAEFGLRDPRRDDQLEAFFRRQGILEDFRNGGVYSFEKELLESNEGLHEAIPLIRALRRIADLEHLKILEPGRVGADGRVHPTYDQLGAHTGRVTCREPNLLGLARIFRPLIVPDPGRGIGETDWCQIEIGIAAAVYRDPELIRMFNATDVYMEMAKVAFRDRLTAEDLGLEPQAFKKRHRALRDQMKACTLGLIYGLTEQGLARRLRIPTPEAQALIVDPENWTTG